MPLELNYYYGNEAEQYSFYRIPKVLFTDKRFKGITVEAKVLYGLLLDRMGLSLKNNWLDAEGRVYIIFTIADVMETLGCAEQKANKLLNELDSLKGIGLIERIRRGLGKPNIIYVKNFTDSNCPESQIKNCENHKSGNVIFTDQELRKSQTNNTYMNNTDFSDTDLSIYPAGEMTIPLLDMNGTDRTEKIDEMDSYRSQIKENIDYEILVQDEPYNRERLDGFVELMAEVYSSKRESMRINQEDVRTDIVKSRFRKLDSGHIRYVLDCLDKNTTAIGNIRAYMLSALFNAPVTIKQYYASLVRHDMAERYGGG